MCKQQRIQGKNVCQEEVDDLGEGGMGDVVVVN
jgi:hypothetical protein